MNTEKKQLTFNPESGEVEFKTTNEATAGSLASAYAKEQDTHGKTYKDFIAGYDACENKYIALMRQERKRLLDLFMNQPLEKLEPDIHSVKRLSDGEVFSIGQKVFVPNHHHQLEIIRLFTFFNYAISGFVLYAEFSYAGVKSVYQIQDLNP